MIETSEKQKRMPMKVLLWVAFIALSALIALFAVRYQGLFRAAITQTGTSGNASSTTGVYIPNNYQGNRGDVGTLNVLAGEGFGSDPIKGVTAVFDYNPNQVIFTQADLESGLLSGAVLSAATSKSAIPSDYNPVEPNRKKVTINIAGLGSPVVVAKDEILFKLKLTVKSDAPIGKATITPVSFKVSKADYSLVSKSFVAGDVLQVNLNKCAETDLCNAWGSCDANGNQSRICDKTPPATCDATGVSPAVSRVCVCATAADWTCRDWSLCQGGSQSRDCSPLNNCSGNGGRPALTQACSTVANCFKVLEGFKVAGTDIAHSSVHAKVTLTPGNWTLNGESVTVPAGSTVAKTLVPGTYVGSAPGVGSCGYTVECYTSIDTVGAKKSFGSNDPAKLLLYDFDGDGHITVDDKISIFNASQQCN